MSEIYSLGDGYVSVPNRPDLVQYRFDGKLEEPESVHLAILQQAEISNRTLLTIKSGIIFLAVVQALAIAGYLIIALRVYKTFNA